MACFLSRCLLSVFFATACFLALPASAQGTGDVAPAEIDDSTHPATARVIGNGDIDIADVVLLLRASVDLVRFDGTPDLGRLPAAVTNADFRDGGHANPDLVELGRLLFFDKELSGNRNISCATCHHSLTGTSDGLSLPIGEGAIGLGPARDTGAGAAAVPERVPRNAPAVFNLGATEFTRMFHDGRVEVDSSTPSGFRNPAGSALPAGLTSVLSVQAMFPVTSSTEMAGQPGENSLADAAGAGNLAGAGGVWEQLAARLVAIPEYVSLFEAAFDDIDAAGDISYVHAAEAIAAFEATAWRADDSPFDRFLRGDVQALSGRANRGMNLFYGKAGCADCHSGPFQTDQDFHAIAMPQVGPGKGQGIDGHEDHGRIVVTDEPDDLHAFRTPSLRNVELTGPWGHGGAYATLEAVLRHVLDPVVGLETYDSSQARLPTRPDLDAVDFLVQDDPSRRAAIAESNELASVDLDDDEFDDLLAFLQALTDPASLDLFEDVPARVPSGLSIAD